MARFTGGVFSRASGKLAGLVFSNVRDGAGKVQVARNLVIPHDPKSDNQLNQRDKVSKCSRTIKSYPAEVWRELLDKGAGKLPGFQSFQKSFLSGMLPNGDFQKPQNLNTGPEFGWDSAIIDSWVTDPEEYKISVFRENLEFPAGTTLHLMLAWTDGEGWNEVADMQHRYASITLGAASSEIELVVETDPVTDQRGLSWFLLEFPPNSPRPTSRTIGIQTLSTIQDIKNNG